VELQLKITTLVFSRPGWNFDCSTFKMQWNRGTIEEHFLFLLEASQTICGRITAKKTMLSFSILDLE